MRHRRIVSLVALGAVALATFVECTSAYSEEPGGTTAGDAGADADAALVADGSVPDAADAANTPFCDRTKPFSIIEDVTELNSAGSVQNYVARLTADGLEVFFSRALTGADIRIFHATRASRTATFGTPEEVSGLAHQSAELDSHPCPLPDGTGLYFQRSVGGVSGDRDIVFAARAGTSFTAPVAVVGLSGPATLQLGPYLASDQRMWLAYANVDGGANGARRIASAPRLRADAFTPLTEANLGAAAPTDEDLLPVISSDGLTLYFGSQRDGNKNFDVYVTTRSDTDAGWSDPAAVALLNGPTDDTPSWISPDECELYFDRVVGIEYRIFRARRPKP